MDARGLLDQLFQSGRELKERGQDIAEEKLGVPGGGAERDAMLSGMGKGAAVAGALALLLGTGTGRKLAGTGLKLGGLAAVGGLAYKAYQNWQDKQTQPPPPPGPPIGELTGPPAERRSLALLRAMIAAAKADGHVDQSEQSQIDQYIENLGLEPSTLHFVKSELVKPLDPNEVASGADSPEAAAEIYLTSCIMVDAQSPMERTYLDLLAKALELEPDLVRSLEDQAGTS